MLNLSGASLRAIATVIGAGKHDGPVFNADFSGGSIPSAVSFTRSGQATMLDSTGTLTYAPNNLIIGSETIGDAYWDLVNTTETLQGDGSTLLNLAAGFAVTRQIVPVAPGQKYVVSVEVKLAPTASASAIRLTTNNTQAWNTGSTVKAVLTSTWQRISIVHTAGASDTSAYCLIGSADAGGNAGEPECVGNVLVRRSQFEAVTYQTTPSAYIPTTTAAFYGARLDYDPYTLQPKGVLVEVARTNAFTNSSRVGNTGWTTGTFNQTPFSGIAPDGTTTATRFVGQSGQTTCFVYQSANITLGSSYTLSGYVKPSGSRTSFRLQSNFNSGSIIVDYNLIDYGVVGTVANSTGATNVTTFIERAPFGYYRIGFSYTSPVTATGILQIFYDFATGNGTDGWYIWGGQFENGGGVTSYIPTESFSTRAVESVTTSATNFMNGSSGYTIFWEGFINASSAYGDVGLISDNGSPNDTMVYLDVNSNFASYSPAHGGNVTNPAAVRKIQRVAVASDSSSHTIVSNGVTSTTQLWNIGGSPPSLSFWGNGSRTIRRITFYPRKMANTEMQALTTLRPLGAEISGFTNKVIDVVPTASMIAPGRTGSYNFFDGMWYDAAVPDNSVYTTVNGNSIALPLNKSICTADRDMTMNGGLLPKLSGASGFYVEFDVRLSTNDPDHWPAVWLMPIEHNGAQDDHYTGDPAGYERYLELDVDEGGFGPGTLGSAINWFGIWPNYDRVLNNYASPLTLDRTVTHTFGASFEPSGNGIIRWFIDDKQIFSVTGATAIPVAAQKQHFYMIIGNQTQGANVNYTMYFSGLRAYTK